MEGGVFIGGPAFMTLRRATVSHVVKPGGEARRQPIGQAMIGEHHRGRASGANGFPKTIRPRAPADHGHLVGRIGFVSQDGLPIDDIRWAPEPRENRGAGPARSPRSGP